ncbi:hypothetical protein MLD38_026209 [Melastoma candidum]|uniref:Uncharacterized protein n=1 Tax=Melastoma candidum TaxID=119954 RepID=A0ACB9NYS3_9MYRT|nr:hypothetical protein MLD38_026209 [Melastoma candidum]
MVGGPPYSQRWGYVRIITGTILGGILGFYVMHRVEVSYTVGDLISDCCFMFSFLACSEMNSVEEREGSKRKLSVWGKEVGKFLKEQRGRLYIIRRCVVMLLCWQD